MPVGAIVGGGIIAGAGSYFGGKAQADAAGAASANAARAAAQAREDLTGFRLPGQSAMYSLADLYGLDRGGGGSTGRPFADTSQFTNYPGYQFAQKEAIRGLELSNASKGLLKSGANIAGIQDRAAGLASQTFNSYVQQLLAQAGIGAQAAGGSASAGLQGAQLSNQALMAQGAANASSIVGPANILTNALGQYAGMSNLYGGGNNLWASSYLNPNMGMSYPTPAGQGAPGTWMPAPRMAAIGGRFSHGETAIVGDDPQMANAHPPDYYGSSSFKQDALKEWWNRILQQKIESLDRRQDMDRQTVDDMEVIPPYRPTFEDRWPRPEEQFRTYGRGGHIPHYADGGPVSPGPGMVGDLPNIFGSMLGGNFSPSQLNPYIDFAKQSGFFPSNVTDTARGILNDPNVMTANPLQTALNYAGNQSPIPDAASTPASPNAMPITPGINSFLPQLRNNDLWGAGNNGWSSSYNSGSSYQGGFEAGGRVRRGPATVGETRPEIFLPDDPNNPAHVVGQDGPEVRQFEEPGTVLPNEAFDPRVQDVFERSAARTRARYPNVGSTNSPLERFARGQNETSMIGMLDTLGHSINDPIPPNFGEDRKAAVERVLPLAGLATGSPLLRSATPGIELGSGMFRRLFGKSPEPITPEVRNLQQANNLIDALLTNRGEMTGREMSAARRIMNDALDQTPKYAREDPAQMLLNNPRLLRTVLSYLNKDERKLYTRLESNAPPVREATMSQEERHAPVSQERIEPQFPWPERAKEVIQPGSTRGALDYWAEPSGQPAPYEPPAPLGVPETPRSVVRRAPPTRRTAPERPVAEGPVNDLAPASTMPEPAPTPELSRIDKMRAIAAAGIVQPGPHTIARRQATNLPPLGPQGTPPRPRMLESEGPDLSGTMSPDELMWLRKTRGYAYGGRPMPGAPSMVGDQPGGMPMSGGLPMTPGLGMMAGRTVPGNELASLMATASSPPLAPDATNELSQFAMQPQQPQFDPRQMMQPRTEPDKTFNVLLDFSRRLNSLNQIGR